MINRSFVVALLTLMTTTGAAVAESGLASIYGNRDGHATPGELDSLDEVPAGQGAIVRNGRNKIAAFRDDKGALQLRSPVCTHLGCLVHWNSTEGCWDCPCHGSHFAPDGAVLNGPALSPLKPVDREGNEREHEGAKASA